MIIANVEVEANVSEKKYLPIIEKFEGIYPLKKDCTMNIMLEEKPIGGLPKIEAEVNESHSNIEYIFGIDTIAVREELWPHKLVRKESFSPLGHAHSLEDCPEIGVAKGDVLYFRGKIVDKKQKQELMDYMRKCVFF